MSDLSTNSNSNENPLSSRLRSMISCSVSVPLWSRLPLESGVALFRGVYVSPGCLVKVKGQKAG